MMKSLSAILLVSIFFLNNALADEEYVCTHGDAKRVISIDYENNTDFVPCQVQYDKGEGAVTLWTAEADENFCRDKTIEFVAKQEAWGWSCKQVSIDIPVDDLISDLY